MHERQKIMLPRDRSENPLFDRVICRGQIAGVLCSLKVMRVRNVIIKIIMIDIKRFSDQLNC